MERKSYGTAYIDFCVSAFEDQKDVDALSELETAIDYDPDVGNSIDTFYRIAFATYPSESEFSKTEAESRVECSLCT